MNYRSIAIRVLYISLGFAALTGITAVFVPTNSNILWRLLGTALATGVSAAFMLLAVRALENPMTRPVGTTLGIIICVVLPLIFASIWLDTIQTIRNNVVEHFALTAFIIFLCGFPLILGSALLTRKGLRKSGILLIVCWIILALLWTIDIWGGGIWSYNYINAIAIPVAWCSPVAALLLVRWPRFVIPLILIATTCVLWQWYGSQAKNDWIQYKTPLAIMMIVGWLPCTLSLWCLLTIRKHAYRIRRFEIAATCFGSLAIALCFAFAWTAITRTESDILLRFAIASSILGGTSVLGVFITQLLKMSMLVKSDTAPLQATCPRCSESLNLPQGKSSCHNCNLQFKLMFESPNCRNCGYDVTQTNNNLCPECGEPIGTSSTS